MKILNLKKICDSKRLKLVEIKYKYFLYNPIFRIHKSLVQSMIPINHLIPGYIKNFKVQNKLITYGKILIFFDTQQNKHSLRLHPSFFHLFNGTVWYMFFISSFSQLWRLNLLRKCVNEIFFLKSCCMWDFYYVFVVFSALGLY